MDCMVVTWDSMVGLDRLSWGCWEGEEMHASGVGELRLGLWCEMRFEETVDVFCDEGGHGPDEGEEDVEEGV